MEKTLADRDDLAEERFTVADITGMAGFALADFANLDMPDTCPRLQDWRARVQARHGQAPRRPPDGQQAVKE